MGEPNCAKAARVWAALVTWLHAGVARPSKRQMRLVMTLSIEILDAITPEPV